MRIFSIILILVLGFGVLGNFALAKPPQAPDCSIYCEDPERWSEPKDTVCICPPIKAKKFEDLVQNIVDFLFNIAVVLAPVMIVVAGFLFVTSGGNPEQIWRAKNLMIWTIIGFVIIMLSKGLVAIIRGILGG